MGRDELVPSWGGDRKEEMTLDGVGSSEAMRHHCRVGIEVGVGGDRKGTPGRCLVMWPGATGVGYAWSQLERMARDGGM